MENQIISKPLEQKLALLKALKEGNIEQSQSILKELTKTSKTNPELYQKFHQFVTQHKTEIIEMEKEDKQQQPQIVIVDGDEEDDWKTDDSADLSQSESDQMQQATKEQEKLQKRQNPAKPFKNVINSKSAIFLKPVKDAKRQFLVQTKPKENLVSSSTMNLREKSGNKIIGQLKNHDELLSKAKLFSRNSNKSDSKTHFPKINNTKPNLKL